MLGENSGLIVTAFTLASRVQGNAGQEVEGDLGEVSAVGGMEQFAKVSSQPELAVVFEGVDEFSDFAGEQSCGAGLAVGWWVGRTAVANIVVRYLAWNRVAADLAKWWLDKGDISPTLPAKVGKGAGKALTAGGAVGGVDKIKNG